MKYIAYAERQTGHWLKRFSLDGGGEFINQLLSPRLEELGIITRVTAPYTAEQNGVSERSNRTINTKACCMMIQSNAPIKYWYHAVQYSVMLQSRTLTTALEMKETPYQKWYGRKPRLNHFKPFGCLAYQQVQKSDRHGKFVPVSHMGVLLGVAEENYNYKILDLETNNTRISHDVTFQPLVFPLQQDKVGQLGWDLSDDNGIPVEEDDLDSAKDVEENIPMVEDDDDELLPLQKNEKQQDDKEIEAVPDVADNNQDMLEELDQGVTLQEEIPTRRSNQESKQVERFRPGGHGCENAKIQEHESSNALKDRVEPKSYKMAMKIPNSKEWREACEKEIKNIKDMGVWEIID